MKIFYKEHKTSNKLILDVIKDYIEENKEYEELFDTFFIHKPYYYPKERRYLKYFYYESDKQFFKVEIVFKRNMIDLRIYKGFRYWNHHLSEAKLICRYNCYSPKSLFDILRVINKKQLNKWSNKNESI